jgi:hypothetical protein
MNKATHGCAAALSVMALALCANTSQAQEAAPQDAPEDQPQVDVRPNQSEADDSVDGAGCDSDQDCRHGRVCVAGACSVEVASLPVQHPYSPDPDPAPSYQETSSAPHVGWRPGSDRPQRRFDFQQGDKMPEGFHLEETPRYGLVAGGAVTFGTLWIASIFTAIGLDKEPAQDDDPNFDDMYWPMFIPAVGPLIAIGTADSSGTGAAILALDGALQLAGIGMFIAGFAAPTVEIVEDRDLTITPMADSGGGGLSLSTEF